MSTKYRCLIVDDMHESISEMLQNIGVESYYKPKITREEIISEIADYDFLFIRSKTRVDSDLLRNANKLKVIGRAGSGTDNLDLEWIENKGIQVINAPEGNQDAVAEHTIALLLSIINNVVKSDKEVRTRLWDREGNRGEELSSKTVGIIGYGYMGKAVVKRLKAFRCNILVYDKYIKDYEFGHQQKVELNEIFDKCDVISFHVPLTEETRGWVDSEFIKRFRKNIHLINTARGEIVKNRALVEHLNNGKLKGVALDVLQNEKIQELSMEELKDFEFLATSEKTILTPHIGGWSKESYYKINKVLVDKLETIVSKL